MKSQEGVGIGILVVIINAMATMNCARTDHGEVRLNLTAQGYYAQLIAKFRQNVIDGFSGHSRCGNHR
jgi:uncharacterized protein YcgL (UPF0745 family)